MDRKYIEELYDKLKEQPKYAGTGFPCKVVLDDLIPNGELDFSPIDACDETNFAIRLCSLWRRSNSGEQDECLKVWVVKN